jgi:hypothetical protein
MESAGKRSGQAFSDAQYDLFIVDVCRYRREGIVAATQYRRLGGEAPVIIGTNAKAIEDAPDGLDAGANDYFANRLSWGNCPCEYRHGSAGTELTGALSVRTGCLNSTRLLATQARTAGAYTFRPVSSLCCKPCWKNPIVCFRGPNLNSGSINVAKQFGARRSKCTCITFAAKWVTTRLSPSAVTATV